MKDQERELFELVEQAENVSIQSVVLGGRLIPAEESSQEEVKEVHVSFLEEEENPADSSRSRRTEDQSRYPRALLTLAAAR